MEPAAVDFVLPLYLSPIFENEAHAPVFQYPYLFNGAAP